MSEVMVGSNRSMSALSGWLRVAAMAKPDTSRGMGSKTLIAALLMLAPAFAQDPTASDLTQATLEDLMNIQVTSVSKKDQQAFRAGAAIFVITQDDIRRSGAINIPDVLRMVPGIEVAQVDNNAWAISIRGFNSVYANKLLVLVDGRSVYTPAFSGVYWDQLNVPLENIERIEVIRGPGGTVWGANAMNGVINIITFSSKATHGGLVRAGTGSQDSLNGLVQYGGDLGGKGAYRVFGGYSTIGNSTLTMGLPGADGWRSLSGGFRSDWDLSDHDTLTVEGNLLQAREGESITEVLANNLPMVATFNDPVRVGSGDLLATWDHTFQGGSDVSVQSYYSHYNRRSFGYDNALDTADLEVQHHIAAGSRQDIVWGVDFRYTESGLTPGYSVSFSPPEQSDFLFNVFFQDEIRLTRSLALTAGAKFGRNQISGFEFQPSAQLVWSPSSRQTFWVAAAQALGEPSLNSLSIQYDAAVVPLPGGAFGVVTELGAPHLKAEQLRDFEGGYRAQLNKRWSLDLTLFRSYYRNQETASPGAPFLSQSNGVFFEEFPYYAGNLARENSYGGEVFGNLRINNRWRISPGLSILHLTPLAVPAGVIATYGLPGDSAKHHAELRSSFTLRRNLEWDTSVYFSGTLPEDRIPAYTRVDTRLGWRMGESLELSIAGQNLLTPRHLEFDDPYVINSTQIHRSVLAKVVWRF
jgi:iron complex outermembrane receptor protein